MGPVLLTQVLPVFKIFHRPGVLQDTSYILYSTSLVQQKCTITNCKQYTHCYLEEDHGAVGLVFNLPIQLGQGPRTKENLVCVCVGGEGVLFTLIITNANYTTLYLRSENNPRSQEA